MALSFDGTSAPTQGADAAVDSTGITVTLPSDTAAALIVASEDMLWRPGVHTGSATTWQSVPASVPMILHELGGRGLKSWEMLGELGRLSAPRAR